MRLFTLLFFIMLVSTEASAQRSAAVSQSAVRPVTASRAIDTLLSPTLDLPCADEVYVFTAEGEDVSGYVGGTNSYFDKEKAIHLTAPVSSEYWVVGVVAYFFPPDDAAISDRELVAFVSEVAEDGSPGEILATSEAIAISDLNVAEGQFLPTVFPLPENLDMFTNEFFVSIDFTDVYESDSGDIGLWMTDTGCAADPNPSWEWWQDETWHNIEDANGWNQTSEWVIGAVIDDLSSTRNLSNDWTLTLSPNPTAGQLSISLNLIEASELRVEVGTCGSTILRNLDLGYRAAGAVDEQIDLSDLPAGMYWLRILTKDGIATQRLVIH